MFQGKRCFRWPETIDAVIQYVQKQRDIVDNLIKGIVDPVISSF